MPSAERFRFNAKSAFLTYPRCECSKERLREFLVTDLGVSIYCIARERHEDGGHHLHAYVEWSRKPDWRVSDRFDLDGHHPNIQRVRNKRASLIYIHKEDDNPLTNIDNIDDYTGSKQPCYGDLIDRCTNATEFLEEVVRIDPRRACYGFNQLRAFAEWKWPIIIPPYEPTWQIEDFNEQAKVVIDFFTGWSGGAPVPSLPCK